MKHPIPSTRLSTRLSGSARETEGRVRNILQGQRRRPPVLLILLFLTVIALCGSLVACREGGSAPSEQLPTDSSVPNILEEPQPGEYLLAYPIQAGGRTLTLHLYVKAISDDHPEFRGVRQVAVTEGERLLQTLPVQEALDAEWSEPGGFGSEYTECVDEEHLISIVDLDSDGNQDFGLFGWITTGANLPYYYWMWDPAEEGFDYGFCLSNAEPTAEQTTGLPGTPRNLILSHTR